MPAALVVDALGGPQVSLDGVRLIGRAPSRLADEFRRYARARGMKPTIPPDGDAMSDEVGLLVRAQRAVDVLLSRAFFAGRFVDRAYTLHDCVPADEGDIR